MSTGKGGIREKGKERREKGKGADGIILIEGIGVDQVELKNGGQGMNSYRKLQVWRKSVAFVTEIYCITGSFPKEELYGLTSQLRRCAVSIPSNIAEGYGRYSTADYIHCLRISMGLS